MTRFATHFGAYEITPMPGQPQVAICHGFFVPTDRRGNGFAKLLKRNQNDHLAANLHDFGICTVDSSNAAQKAVLTDAGWHKLAEFSNRRSGGITELWGFDVQKGGGNGIGE